MLSTVLKPRRLAVLAVAGTAILVPTLASAQVSAPPESISCWERGAYLTAAVNGKARYGQKAVCNTHHTAVVVLYRNGAPASYFATVSRPTPGGNQQSGTSDPAAFASAAVDCGVGYQVKVWVSALGDGQADVFYTSGAPRTLC